MELESALMPSGMMDINGLGKMRVVGLEEFIEEFGFDPRQTEDEALEANVAAVAEWDNAKELNVVCHTEGLSNMDWEFFWIILIVIGLDGYLYWHFSHIFNLQYDLTNKLLTKFHTQEPQTEVNTVRFRYYRK